MRKDFSTAIFIFILTSLTVVSCYALILVGDMHFKHEESGFIELRAKKLDIR